MFARVRVCVRLSGKQCVYLCGIVFGGNTTISIELGSSQTTRRSIVVFVVIEVAVLLCLFCLQSGRLHSIVEPLICSCTII